MKAECEKLPEAWARLLPEGIAEAPLAAVEAARRNGMTVYPPAGTLFAALRLTPPEAVKAVILGQDPYHEAGEAMGIAFAVPPQNGHLPPSLRNILREYADDLQCPVPARPDLRQWARHGVLLLNTVFSVEAHRANSHARLGWQEVSDAIIRAVSQFCEPCVFILWGAPAQRKLPLVDAARHGVICSAHPSPLSAWRGFFGSRPFSRTNDWLAAHNRKPVDWSLCGEAAPDEAPEGK